MQASERVSGQESEQLKWDSAARFASALLAHLINHQAQIQLAACVWLRARAHARARLYLALGELLAAAAAPAS